MSAAFDASMLVYVVTPNALAPIDPTTGYPVERCGERVDHLLNTLQKSGTRIIIPAPALAEVLVKALDAAAEYLTQLTKSRHFSIRPFDTLAAVEHADIQRERRNSGAVPKSASRPKAKFDDQIFAIARIAQADTIYSDDPDIRKLCSHFGVACVGIAELPLPPEDPQMHLDLEQTGRDAEAA
jgi:predicted nucleic acid-binding protein